MKDSGKTKKTPVHVAYSICIITKFYYYYLAIISNAIALLEHSLASDITNG
jgi:hypothetical protein